MEISLAIQLSDREFQVVARHAARMNACMADPQWSLNDSLVSLLRKRIYAEGVSQQQDDASAAFAAATENLPE